MKKLSIVVFVLSVLSLSATAQNELDNRDKLQFGLKAGLNLANVYDAQGEQFQADGKLGLAGGAFLAIPIGTYLGIQPEVLASQKGFQGSGVLFGSAYEYSHTTNYLDVPLYFTFKPSEFFTFLVGPQFSYLLSSQDKFNSGLGSILQEQEFDNDNIRKNTMSISVGADVNIQHFVISARAAWDFQDNKSDGTSSMPRYKNQWLQFTVGYKFYKN